MPNNFEPACFDKEDTAISVPTEGLVEVSPEVQQRVINAILINLLRNSKGGIDLNLGTAGAVAVDVSAANATVAQQRFEEEEEEEEDHELSRARCKRGDKNKKSSGAGASVNQQCASAVGLLAFGMTTVLLNLHNAGAYPKLGTVVPAMGITFGGIAQILVGVLEYFHHNNFGFIAFTSYGCFWLSLVCVWMLPTENVSPVVPSAPSFVATYLLLWGMFSAVMFCCSLTKNVALAAVFGTLVVLFVLLAAGDYTGNAVVTKIAGIEGVICGATAMYLAFAEILENQTGRWILPVYPLSR